MSEEEQQAKKVTEEVPDPELDNLLNDALQDFNKPQPIKPVPGADLASKVAALGIQAATSTGSDGAAGDVWTEEFIQQATAQFEQTMRSLMEKQQGSGQADKPGGEAPKEGSHEELPQIDLSAMSAQFAQFAEAASKSSSGAQPAADFMQCIDETMKQLGQNNEQLQNSPTASDLNKMFENLGLAGGEEAEGALGGLFPLMQVMLENILSKEVLYSPMKEIVDKYPDWLADHRSTLSEEDFTRYNKQYDIMKQVVELYEEEQEDDTDEIKGQRFERIMQSMQKLQEMGQPPQELVGEMGPILNFDEAGNSVLPDMSTLLGAAGFPGGAATTDDPRPAGAPDQQAPGEQCTLM
ncbi:peroxisomal biogenesis factor 19 [Procambarus clarkii]|uniref:peroxisomal biogenesis factor 19 n=1 Tax=Procambarus clarkii TaxID=6728 RepID=UPI001E6787E3|nr:peroxisomal biogenesis factor 19-like [Procambarus clarkii]XP_045592504.1 peroxisomal biogenesis factor 19-like [Procambarus clarkii]XP_045592505.1 peroxisomal biogenesis factor 19-like [Procambarus clarkii]